MQRIGKSDIYLEPAQSYSAQRENGFIARKDNVGWPLRLPMDWAADPFNDPNWRSKLEHWRMTDPILVEYYKTSDTNLLREAFDYVLDWHRFHIVEGRDASHAWRDAVVGIRAIRIAYFLDSVDSGTLDLSESETCKLRELADLHETKLLEPNFIVPNNHGLFQAFGLKLLARVSKDRARAVELSGQADDAFRKVVDEQFDAYGVHKEHSPDYHLFGERIVSKFAPHFAGTDVARVLSQAASLRPWYTFPDGYRSRAGDSSGGRSADQMPGEPVRTFFDGGKCIVGDLTRSGYAIVRDSALPDAKSMLFVTGMANTLTHKHADDLSFELFEFGRRVLIDAGKFGYFRGSKRAYVKSAVGHNTIGLANRPVLPSEIDLKGSLLSGIETDSHEVVISGTVRRPGLFQQDRTFAYRPGRYLVVRDEVTAQVRNHLVSTILFAPDWTVVIDGKQVVATCPTGETFFGEAPEASSLSHERGRPKPMIGWYSPNYGALEPTSAVRAGIEASIAVLTWTFWTDEIFRPDAIASRARLYSRAEFDLHPTS